MSRRTSVSGDFDSRNCRVIRRSSSCSSEKAKFMAGTLGRGGGAVPRPCVHACYGPLMERVGIRELRNNVAAVVRRAAGGERIVVTVDGVPVAQLGPLEGATALSVDDLVAAGLALPPG